MQLAPSWTVARLATHCTGGNSLEKDEMLCRRWRDRHDISAAHQLAKRHRRLVAELAEIYRPSGLPWNDLVGEGQLGLMHALCRFDPDQGVGFTTYAAWCITGSLQSYIQTNSPRAFGRTRVGNSQRRSDDVNRIRRSLVPAIYVPYPAAHG
jgi:DNA-directed RNA polymerase sigma subunit (sigma70/sigma32)